MYLAHWCVKMAHQCAILTHQCGFDTPCLQALVIIILCAYYAQQGYAFGRVRLYVCIFTLCAYAQQGYAFGRVGLCAYMYICIIIYIYIYNYIYICQQKNRLFSALPLENFLLSVMSCLLFKYRPLY